MIYLDHAATSYPKPKAVLAAVQHWYEQVGVSAERGEGPRTREAQHVVQTARHGIGALTGHGGDRVAFCSGATEGLNLVLRALLQPGSKVLSTVYEHASVVRPLLALQQERAFVLHVPQRNDAETSGTAAPPLEEVLIAQIETLRPHTLVFTHASNVTGAVIDAARICKVARQHGTITVLDVSQTVGYLPIDVGADVIVGSGHKALHGPPGIGFVSIAAGIVLPPQKFGGTGSSVALEQHPQAWPQAFEAGTPNTPAIFGLLAALQWLSTEGSAELHHRAMQRIEQLASGLSELRNIRVFTPKTAIRTPVLSFVHDSYDPLEIGAILAASGMQARAGFHCAPWIHASLGTALAGTVRISTGPDTTDEDVRTLLGMLGTL